MEKTGERAQKSKEEIKANAAKMVQQAKGKAHQEGQEEEEEHEGSEVFTGKKIETLAPEDLNQQKEAGGSNKRLERSPTHAAQLEQSNANAISASEKKKGRVDTTTTTTAAAAAAAAEDNNNNKSQLEKGKSFADAVRSSSSSSVGAPEEKQV
eukprot:GEZU01019859.1.p2 GENE.GEZU01019859.1~~GEZU01019859.1.p2  ORF type:complete len:153 (+),score=88.82 GEZU01019859.1:429-887(+)